MDANAAIIASGLKQVLQIPISFDQEFQEKDLELDKLHGYSLIRKYTPQTSCTVRLLRHGSWEILPSQFFVFVKNVSGKSTIVIDVYENDFVENLKHKIKDKEGIPVRNQRLMFNNEQLEDGCTLSSYNITKECTINLVIRLLGGGGCYSFLPEKIFDPKYDFVYPGIGQDSRAFSRGNRSFTRPYGWYKKALKVLGVFENNEWLGVSRDGEVNSSDKEWPVSYHGTQKEFAESITEEGYVLKKGKRFAFGIGIYSSPDPKVAESYASAFNYKGANYKLIFMNRVNMEYTKEVKLTNGNIYFVTSDERQIRPYAILFKKL